MIVIEKIDDNEQFEHKGDVHVTGSVGRNATIIIKGGNFIIDGNVGDHTEVTLASESNSSVVINTSSFFMNNISIGGINTGKQLLVKGDVGDNVILSSHNADFVVDGNVGKQCVFNTHNGEITTGSVGENTSLETHNGNIRSGNVSKNSSLKTHNGKIKARDMAEHSRAISHNGNVSVANAHQSAFLDTHNGSVYENDVKRKKEKLHTQGNVVSNISLIGNRFLVNGKDITDLVNGANHNSSRKEEPPVRYIKSFK